MSYRKAKITKLVMLGSILALALMAFAFSHHCLHPIHHGESSDSDHHCLLCTVFSKTLASLSPLESLPTPLVTTHLLLIEPISIGDLFLQISLAVRAPPRMELN